MKKQKRAVHLHDFLITEIMARLPPKSIIRFHCLSKSWGALLKSPFFIKMHLSHGKESKYSDMQRLIISRGNILHLMSYQTCEKTTILMDFPIDYLQLLGSCNGLLCLPVSKKTLILWNPSTKGITYITLSSLLDLRDTFGFGYDHSTGDYKIIRFVHLTNAEDLSRGPIYVYSLKSNTWKRIQLHPLNLSLLENSMTYFRREGYSISGTFVDGVLYWDVTCIPNVQPSTEDLGIVRRVLGFDLICEKFEAIPPPNDEKRSFTLRVIGGCLSLGRNLNGRSIEMWKLEKDNTKQSWIKFMTVTNLATLPDSYRLIPICVMENGEVLIAYSRGVGYYGIGTMPWGFHLYDPAKQTFRRIMVDGVGQLFQVTTYVKSLVSPHPESLMACDEV